MVGNEVVNRYIGRLFSSPVKKNTYNVGKYQLILSDGHPLPEYQRTHPCYDRFLPYLVKILPEGSVVIDVGANVGDTVAAMLEANEGLEYVCIEADKQYFNILIENVKKIRTVCPGAIIHTINEFVGDSIDNISLEGAAGTKHAVLGGGDIRSKTLDSIVSKLDIPSQVSLLKSDTDGFDYDVIRSGRRLLASKSLLYFECQFDMDGQINEYVNLLNELIAYGYESFALFDNFGQYIGIFNNICIVIEMMHYVERQNKAKGTRTIYYYDILAFDAGGEHQVKNAISDYLARH